MTDRRAAIVTLGRAQGMGEVRRVESWQMILDAAGFRSDVVRLRRECAPSLRRPPHLGAVMRGTAPPETLAWSVTAARERLKNIGPDLTVFVTLRAFEPTLVDVAGVAVLDLVDRLSTSYEDRASVSESWHEKLWFSWLARAMARVERHHHPGVLRTAAGRSDALELDAKWIPNVVDVPNPAPAIDPDHDLVFFGNLAYQPNVAAVMLLAEWWPEVQQVRPGTTLLLTGRNPVRRVVDAAHAMGADLEAGYPDPTTAARRGRVAVAPLTLVAGIQNKVIEAAAAGVPQILSSAAARGLPDAFPCRIADGPAAFTRAVVELLDTPAERAALADAALKTVREEFTATAVAPRVLEAAG